MTGQKPAAAEKNESANPVLNQSILVVTLVLTGGISTPGAVLKLWLGALRPPRFRVQENGLPFEKFGGTGRQTWHRAGKTDFAT